MTLGFLPASGFVDALLAAFGANGGVYALYGRVYALLGYDRVYALLGKFAPGVRPRGLNKGWRAE